MDSTYCINATFPEFDHCIVVGKRKFLFIEDRQKCLRRKEYDVCNLIQKRSR